MIKLKRVLLLILGIVTTPLLFSFTTKIPQEKQQINWITIEQAIVAHQQKPKKMLFDVYTDWCTWCKQMDATTFQHPQIIDFINKNFYAVKFNAESTDEITVNGKKYGSSNPNKSKSTHQYAIEMLQGKISYPSLVLYDETLNNIGIIAGFNTAKKLEPLLNYFSVNAYKKQSWENYNANFKSQLK